MWNRYQRQGLSLFFFLATLSPPILGNEPLAPQSFEDIQICNSTSQDVECESTSCVDQCLKDDGSDAEECRMSCNIST